MYQLLYGHMNFFLYFRRTELYIQSRVDKYLNKFIKYKALDTYDKQMMTYIKNKHEEIMKSGSNGASLSVIPDNGTIFNLKDALFSDDTHLIKRFIECANKELTSGIYDFRGRESEISSLFYRGLIVPCALKFIPYCQDDLLPILCSIISRNQDILTVEQAFDFTIMNYISSTFFESRQIFYSSTRIENI